MSERNLEVVRDGIDAWNRHDWEAGLENMAPDIVWRTSGVVPDLEKTYRGHDGVRAFWNAWTETWDHINIAVDELADLGDTVLVLARFRAGSRGEMKVDQPVAFLFWVRDQQVTEFQSYWDQDSVWTDVRSIAPGFMPRGGAAEGNPDT